MATNSLIQQEKRRDHGDTAIEYEQARVGLGIGASSRNNFVEQTRGPNVAL